MNLRRERRLDIFNFKRFETTIEHRHMELAQPIASSKAHCEDFLDHALSSIGEAAKRRRESRPVGVSIRREVLQQTLHDAAAKFMTDDVRRAPARPALHLIQYKTHGAGRQELHQTLQHVVRMRALKGFADMAAQLRGEVTPARAIATLKHDLQEPTATLFES